MKERKRIRVWVGIVDGTLLKDLHHGYTYSDGEPVICYDCVFPTYRGAKRCFQEVARATLEIEMSQ